MKMHHVRLIAALSVVSFLAPYAEATAMRVVVVHTENPADYAKEIEKGRELMKKAGSTAEIRVWQARYAGQDAGTVVVSIEYKDLADLATDEGRIASDAQLSAWIKGLDRIRKIVSDSIYYELK